MPNAHTLSGHSTRTYWTTSTSPAAHPGSPTAHSLPRTSNKTSASKACASRSTKPPSPTKPPPPSPSKPRTTSQPAKQSTTPAPQPHSRPAPPQPASSPSPPPEQPPPGESPPSPQPEPLPATTAVTPTRHLATATARARTRHPAHPPLAPATPRTCHRSRPTTPAIEGVLLIKFAAIGFVIALRACALGASTLVVSLSRVGLRMAPQQLESSAA